MFLECVMCIISVLDLVYSGLEVSRGQRELFKDRPCGRSFSYER